MGKDKKKFNLYNLFNSRESELGVEKKDVITKFNFINFFKLYKRKFSKLIYVNAFYILGNFPIFFALLALAKYFDQHASAPVSPHFAIANGIEMLGLEASPHIAALSGIFGKMTTVFAPTTTTYIFYILGALTIFTFGLVNVGCTYIIRNLIKGEPVFLWSDFIYAIKRNFRQGLIMGIIDCIVTAVLAYDIFFFWYNYNIGMGFILFWLSLIMAIMYCIMRFYIYVMLITFDLSIFKCIKNSLIFSVLSLGRNVLAFLGIIFVLLLTFMLYSVFQAFGFLIPIILLFSTIGFIGIYSSYPKIKKYMIDPYYDSEGNPLSEYASINENIDNIEKTGEEI